MKRWHEFYLDEDLSERLATMAAKPGSPKTAIMTDALKAYIDRRAASELDERFKTRLDKQSHQLARIERNHQILAETVALLARFQFLFTAPLPESDRAGRAMAQERFKAFVEQVSRRISSGRSLIEDVLSLSRPSERDEARFRNRACESTRCTHDRGKGATHSTRSRRVSSPEPQRVRPSMIAADCHRSTSAVS